MGNECSDQPYSGRFVDAEHRFAVRVYFEDTDAGGVVYHAAYLRFMERARSDMLRAIGIDQRAAMEAGEGVYMVASLAIHYRRPAKLEDELIVVSRVREIRAASCVIHQRVIRDDELVAEADVTAAFITPDGRPRRQPPEWVGKFTALKRDN